MQICQTYRRVYGIICVRFYSRSCSKKEMGSGESTTRRVSFGLDEDDRVRILRGVKLSEDVLQRMRNVSADQRQPVSNKENLSQQTPTYEQQQAIIQEELARIARKEREAARQDITRAVQRERVQTRQESEKAKQLVRLFYRHFSTAQYFKTEV
ncbi:MICOS complex subunit mic25a [Labeo rohita]|uniref:MICOS complex subunit mic25a n=1 Tax=Labeo rohita TaxID=84645 RepID=A0ABQ8LFT4_LABRO|nr:MICOS complex subunit mic25a [Labeo rohita]